MTGEIQAILLFFGIMLGIIIIGFLVMLGGLWLGNLDDYFHLKKLKREERERIKENSKLEEKNQTKINNGIFSHYDELKFNIKN